MTAVVTKKTITTIFFLPVFKIGKERLNKNGFINAYQKDITADVEYENCIFALFKPEDIDLFDDFLDEEYERTKAIIDDYDYDGGYIVLVYKLDMKFKKDYDLVKKGNYSKTSKQFQELFPRVIKVKKNGFTKDEVSLQYRVFNKTEELREYWENKLDVEFDETMELWDGYQEENEILDIEKIKQHV